MHEYLNLAISLLSNSLPFCHARTFHNNLTNFYIRCQLIVMRDRSTPVPPSNIFSWIPVAGLYLTPNAHQWKKSLIINFSKSINYNIIITHIMET